MSSPPYEATFGLGHEPAVEHPASEGTHASPPPYVQSAPPVYFIQGSPPYNSAPSVQIQQIISVPALIQPHNPVKYHETFLKGKPKALGIVIIVTAIVQLILAVAHCFTPPYYASFISGIMFWGPVIYLIAGALSIAAQPKPNTCLIRGSLGMNIVTSIISATGIILSGIDIALYSDPRCHYSNNYGSGYGYRPQYYCEGIHVGALVIVSVLLITDILLFCVSISTSAFGCRSLKHVGVVQQVLVIQNGTVLTSPSSIQADAFLHPPAYPPGYVTPGGPPK